MAETANKRVGTVSPKGFDQLAGLVTVTEADRERQSVEEPFTGGELGTVPTCTSDDVETAVERARAAQAEWEATSVDVRTEVLDRVHDLVLDRRDEVLDILQSESGKSRLHALEEIVDVAINSQYYAAHAQSYLAPEKRRGAIPILTQTYKSNVPVGVVGLITPWNYPLTLTISDSLPALAAGNAVVLKPAPQTPYTALLSKQLLQEAGLPEDLFQVVTGNGPELGGPLIDNVDFVGFTGSASTGRLVAERAGRNLTKCSLELGGKNPVLVHEDADLDRTIEGLVQACFTNAGQLCISGERLYVQSGIYDEFVERFAQAVEEMALGAEYDYGVDMGSLISEEQLEKVVEHVEDAKANGATVLTGGEARPDIGPYFYEPTVLADVDETEMTVGCEETFGPVVAVHPFDDLDIAIERANDSEYGLNSSIWTEDSDLAHEIAGQLECGTVNINDGAGASFGSIDAPMGGMKNSGIGRRHGPEGLLKYTESKTVAEQRFVPLDKPSLLPGSVFARMVTSSLRLLKLIPNRP